MAPGRNPAPSDALTSRGVTHRGDRLRGWLTALPALVLCSPWPGVLQDVPTSVSSAAGWTLLLTLPALLLTALQRRGSWKAIGLVPGAFILLALLSQGRILWGVGDLFGAETTSMSLLAGAALVLCGARLGSEGRRGLIEGLLPIPILILIGSLLADHMGAVLGNAGDAAEAALPAAALGLLAFTVRRGPTRLLALSSLGAYAFWAGMGDSRIASLGFGALALLLVLPNQRPAKRHERRIALVAVGVLALVAGFKNLGPGSPDQASAASAATSEEGGLGFRRLVYGSALGFLGAHPLGVGPGQVAREYPPFRDPQEIALSEHQRAEPTPVDVEHLHQDALQIIAEQGWLLGGAFLLVLAFVASRALGALRKGSSTQAACALATLGFLLTGLVNAPLMAGVAAPAVALPLLGALMAPRVQGPKSKSLGPEGIFAVLLLAMIQPALEFIEHGRAMADLGLAKRAAELAPPEQRAPILLAKARPALDRALHAAPLSVVALAQSARLGDLSPAMSAGVLRRILQLRPHRRAALIDLANREALAGRLQLAHDLQARLRALDPTNPVLLHNALLLALDRRQPEEVAAALTQVQTHNAARETQLRELMQRYQLQGHAVCTAPLWVELGEGTDLTDPQEAFASADRARKRGAEIQGDALLTLAHRGFAHQALDRNDLSGGLRSLRQALRASARGLDALDPQDATIGRGGPILRLELAGVLAANGQDEAAAAELAGIRAKSEDLIRLHPLAGDALLATGLLQGLNASHR